MLGPLMNKINTWIVPGGYLFIGTMVADDFEAVKKDVIGSGDVDGLGGRLVSTRFMGEDAATFVYSRDGWAEMLKRAGFEVLRFVTVPFQALVEADCGLKQHHYLVARKIIDI